MTGELVGTAEAFRAAWVLAGVWFLTGVGADVSSLVFEAVEGPLAEGALVGAREVLADLLVGGSRAFHEGRQHAD